MPMKETVDGTPPPLYQPRSASDTPLSIIGLLTFIWFFHCTSSSSSNGMTIIIQLRTLVDTPQHTAQPPHHTNPSCYISCCSTTADYCTNVNIIIIIGSRRQRRSVTSTWNVHDGRPWTIQRGCRKGYRRRSAVSTITAGGLGVGASWS